MRSSLSKTAVILLLGLLGVATGVSAQEASALREAGTLIGRQLLATGARPDGPMDAGLTEATGGALRLAQKVGFVATAYLAQSARVTLRQAVRLEGRCRHDPTPRTRQFALDSLLAVIATACTLPAR